MTFLETIPLNSTWFGCEKTDGKTIWSMDFLEILKLPERKRFTPIYEKRFSEIKDIFHTIPSEQD